MATMSVCYDCQQLTAGRCWRHQNAELLNQRPAPRPPFNTGESLVAMAHQDAEQRERIAELEAEVERLRRWIDTEGRNAPSHSTVDAALHWKEGR